MHATTRQGDRTRAERRAELWVRSFSPIVVERTQQAAIDRLQRLVATGVIDDFSVRQWGKEVGLSTTAARTERAKVVLDRVGAFREWAEAYDRTLEPFFETRETCSTVTGECYTAQILPVRALAEYYDGELVFVSPSAPVDGSTTCSVGDRLEKLLAKRGSVGRSPPVEDAVGAQSGPDTPEGSDGTATGLFGTPAGDDRQR